MVWLNPLVLLAVAGVAAPILVHLLVQRRAETFAFPTLRFLRPARLASVRRHLFDDLPLLAVRCAILAAAAAALAGPLVATASRRAAWDRRVTRAVVLDVEGPTTPYVKDMRGDTRTGVRATTKLNRKDFGIVWNKAIDGGGVVVGEEIEVTIEVEGVRRADASGG